MASPLAVLAIPGMARAAMRMGASLAVAAVLAYAFVLSVLSGAASAIGHDERGGGDGRSPPVCCARTAVPE